MPLAIATKLVQRLGQSTQLTSHLCSLARGMLLASHSRVGRIDAQSTVDVVLNESLLALGKCVKRLPLSANFAPKPRRQYKIVMEYSLGRISFILDWDGWLHCPRPGQLAK